MYSAVHDLIEMKLYTCIYVCVQLVLFSLLLSHLFAADLCLDLCMPMSVQKLHGINSTTHTLPGVSVQTTLYPRKK